MQFSICAVGYVQIIPPHVHVHIFYNVANRHVRTTYMQFLAARSRCTNLFSARYSIPFAISRHILINTSLDIC